MNKRDNAPTVQEVQESSEHAQVLKLPQERQDRGSVPPRGSARPVEARVRSAASAVGKSDRSPDPVQRQTGLALTSIVIPGET